MRCDCIADDGYTYSFYFHNEPVDQKWILMGIIPTGACLMHMWSQLDDMYHKCQMDNLFNLVNLTYKAYSDILSKVRIHGVTRKGGRGVHPCIHQEELSKGYRQIN